MGEVIAVWDKFDGGHWGNVGPIKAQENQWGGYNAIVDDQQRLGPISAPKVLTFNANPIGKFWGMFWAWGSDGKVYWLQQNPHTSTGIALSTTTSTVYRVTPDPSASQTITTVTTVPFVPTVAPDWALVADELYMTLYSNKTYRIAINGNTTSALAGTYGAAPAGRAICIYGERLVVGGVKDARFGNVPNRLVFSGDDTGNNPTDRTAWETLNYFDIGPPDAVIVGLYPTRDYLTVVMADQTIWTVSGVLGTSAVARRSNGYAKGTGGINVFDASHAAVDPSQTKVWMFDHTVNGVGRFNGASYSRLPHFGYPRRNRTQSSATFGNIVSFRGPDEFVAIGVEVGQESGILQANAANSPIVLVRSDGMFSLHESPSELAIEGGVSAGPARVVGNDRQQLIICWALGNGNVTGIGSQGAPGFGYWFAGAPLWDEDVLGATGDSPYFLSGESAVVQLPYKRPQRTNTEWEIEGFLLDFIPRPATVSPSGTDIGTTTSTAGILISGSVVGDGIPAFSRTVTATTASGVQESSTMTWSTTYGAVASDIWPNVRTAWFPCRLSRVRAARVKLSFNDVRIVAVTLMGKQIPGRPV